MRLKSTVCPGYVSDSEESSNTPPNNKKRKNIQFHMVFPSGKKNKDTSEEDGKQSNDEDEDEYNDESGNDKGNNTQDNGEIPEDLKAMMDYLFGNSNVNYIEIDPNNVPKHLESGSKEKRKSQVDEHRDYKRRITDYPFKWLGNDIKNIDDLINLGIDFDPGKRIRGNLNLFKLNKLVQPLQKLKNMVGLQEVKKVIFEEAIYFLQDLDEGNKEMLHTVIAGPPGVGKTQLAHIIADYYNALGFLKTNKVVSVKRNDLVAGYLGQSAIKTKKKLDESSWRSITN